jgi:chitodextrinase
VPTDVRASNVSATSATIAWSASTDDVAVAGYRLFRDGVLIASPTGLSYADGGLSPSTTYTYAVAAFDGSGNASAPSSGFRVATLAAPTALAAAYGFSEGTGVTTADSSGNGVTGTLSGATWTTGRHGSGLGFDGTSASVDLGDPAVLRTTGSLTVSAWVNESANVADDAIVVAKSSGAAGWELKSSPDTGARTFAFAVYDPGGGYVARYSTTVRSLDTWYHVAGVYDAAARTLDIYIDGLLSNGTLWGTVPGSHADVSVDATIGRRAAGFFLSGVIDDVRVYNRALTVEEIQADVNTAP